MTRWTAVRLPSELSDQEYETLLVRLPIKRRVGVKRFKERKNAIGVLFAYELLRRDLRRDEHIARPVLAYAQAGKPYLPEHPGIHFSLSHSRCYAVCAVSDAPVGTDTETARAVNEAVWRRCLTDNERAWAGDDAERLFRLWTLKESYFKFTGTGLADLMKSVEFTFDGEVPLVNKAGVFVCSKLLGDEACALCSETDDLPPEPDFLSLEDVLGEQKPDIPSALLEMVLTIPRQGKQALGVTRNGQDRSLRQRIY